MSKRRGKSQGRRTLGSKKRRERRKRRLRKKRGH